MKRILIYILCLAPIFGISQQAVIWENLTNITQTGDTLEKTSGTAGFNAHANSTNILVGDGWVKHIVASDGTTRLFGFSENGTNINSDAEVLYSFYTNGTNLLIREAGVQVNTNETYVIGDELIVERVGNEIFYKKNGVAIRQITVDGSKELNAAVVFYTSGAKFEDVITSFKYSFFVQSVQKIDNSEGGLVGNPLENSDMFGYAVEVIGDVDGDGIDDIAVGAQKDDYGQTDQGAVYIMMLNADGSIKNQHKISATSGDGLSFEVGHIGFGCSVAALGDLNGDGYPDISVGLFRGADAGTSNQRGAIYTLFLDEEGKVLEYQKISDTEGGGKGVFFNNDYFGSSIANVGDINGDGLPDLAVGATGSNEGGNDKGAIFIVNLDYNGTAKNIQEITAGTGGFIGVLDDVDSFGSDVVMLGDINGDGINDIAVGASGDDDGGNGRGAVYILFMNVDGTVNNTQKISSLTSGFTEALADDDHFGSGLVNLGDLDGNGVTDLGVGAWGDDEGGLNEGALWLMYLDAAGGIVGYDKIATNDPLLDPKVGNHNYAMSSLSSFGDRNGDGKIDLLAGAWNNGTGKVFVLHLEGPVSNPVKEYYQTSPFITGVKKHSAAVGEPLENELDPHDYYGESVCNIGDLDGDGIEDMVVGAQKDDDGGTDRGAVYVQFMNVDGSIKSFQKISDTEGNFTGILNNGDRFGMDVAYMGNNKIAVGSPYDQDGGSTRGAIWILNLNNNGTVSSFQKISDTEGDFTGELSHQDFFAWSLTSQDINNDGISDLIVVASGDDDGGVNYGAVWTLFMGIDDKVDSFQKISDLEGGLSTYVTLNGNWFGRSVESIGDLNNDGNNDIAVGVIYDDDIATSSGAVYVLFLTDSGTVQSVKKITQGLNGFDGLLRQSDLFGYSLHGNVDLDLDGINDLLVGTQGYDGTSTASSGLVYVLFMNTDGTVKRHQIIDGTSGNFTGYISAGWGIGRSLSVLDFNPNDNKTSIAIGSRTDDGGNNAGGVYVVDIDLAVINGGDFSVQSVQKINNEVGGLTGSPLDHSDYFGEAVAVIGDVNHDGIDDIAVGAKMDDDGQTNQGAIYILFLNADGTVKGQQKISALEGDNVPVFATGQVKFGSTIAGLGDLNGDGTPDIAVGAYAGDAGTDAFNRGAVYILFLNDDGTVLEYQKIASNEGGGPNIGSNKYFSQVANIGDLNKDGLPDLAVGAGGDDDGGTNIGATYICFLDYNGTVKSYQKISATQGGFTGHLDADDKFSNPTQIGDIDGDGVLDLVVNTKGDDDGGTDRGAIWVLFMNTDGTVKSHQKISDTEGGFTGTLDDGDKFGGAATNLGDLDGDGINELGVVAGGDDDAGTNVGALWILYLDQDGTVKSHNKITEDDPVLLGQLSSNGGFEGGISCFGDRNNDGKVDIFAGASLASVGGISTGEIYIMHLEGPASNPKKEYHQTPSFITGVKKLSAAAGEPLENELEANDNYGISSCVIGDLDGDGVNDMVVGAHGDGDGGSARGAVYVQFMNVDGSIKSFQKISDTQGGFTGVLDDSDVFGISVAYLGNNKIAVGSSGDDDGGTDRGAIWVLTLNSDGTVANHQKISSTAGAFTGELGNDDRFARGISSADINKDGVLDLLVGAINDDDGGSKTGSTWVLFMNSDGTVASHQKISPLYGNLSSYVTLSSVNSFGWSVTVMGDMDGDGNEDIAVGALYDNDVAPAAGAVYVLFLTDSGTVKGAQKITQEEGGFDGLLRLQDFFGYAVHGGFDLDLDGVNDLLVGNQGFDDARMGMTGQVFILLMNTDGTVKRHQLIDATTGNFTGNLSRGWGIGRSLSVLDFNPNDNKVSIAIGSRTDDGGGYAGGIYLVDINTAAINGGDFSVQSTQKINNVEGGLVGNPLDAADKFGYAVEVIGDVDHDGIDDIAVGAPYDDSGEADQGAVYILMLNADGTVKNQQKISYAQGGGPNFTNLGSGPAFSAGQQLFGSSIASLGDLNGDGYVDIAVGMPYGGDKNKTNKRGAVFILFLDETGNTLNYRKISNTEGGGTDMFLDNDYFGSTVENIGDINGDGLPDLAISARGVDDGASEAGAVFIVNLDYNGTAKNIQKIANNTGGLPSGLLASTDNFGSSIAGIGDVDGDQVVDIAVGAQFNDDGGNDRGAVWMLLMNTDGTVKTYKKIADGLGGFPLGELDDEDHFGAGLVNMGDLDGNGINDVGVGVPQDDDGGQDLGALWILNLANDGSVIAYDKITSDDPALSGRISAGGKSMKDIANFGDRNGDGKLDLLVGAWNDSDGVITSGSALIMSLNGPRGNYELDNYATPPFITGVKRYTSLAGSPLEAEDLANNSYGRSSCVIEDLDGDGINDMVVGAHGDDQGGTNRGGVYVQFLNADGSIKSYSKIGDGIGGFPTGLLDDSDLMGTSVAYLGNNRIAVGAPNDDDVYANAATHTNQGAVWVLNLNSDGTVNSYNKISNAGGFTSELKGNGYFGFSLSAADINKDGIQDLIVGARNIHDGGGGAGAVWICFMNADGTVNSQQKISNTHGGLSTYYTLAGGDNFGWSVTAMGDVDGDGNEDIAVGALYDDDIAISSGAVYVLFLTDSGTVKGAKKITQGVNGFDGWLAGGDVFGFSVHGGFDFDLDGVNDLLASSTQHDGWHNGANTGLIYVLFMNADGTVKRHQIIDGTTGNFTGNIRGGVLFGKSISVLNYSLTSGKFSIAVGSRIYDGGWGGGIYILDVNLFALSNYVYSFIASNYVYKELKKELDGGYYVLSGWDLHFRYNEQYRSGNLDYKIYEYKGQDLLSSTTVVVPKKYGDNWMSIDLCGMSSYLSDHYYILEVTDEKGRKEYLRFYSNIDPAITPCHNNNNNSGL